MAMVLTCQDGTLFVDVDGKAICDLGTWELVQITDVQFTVADLEAPELASAFMAGFVLVGSIWAITFGIRTIIDMIR
jgi:hypothetical protein